MKLKRTKNFINDFKAFITRGNVIDMAVGVIIAGAFGKITTSIVNDLIMPVFGAVTAGADFASLKFVLTQAVLNEAGEVVTPEAAITYGNLIQNVVDFLLIALSLFVFVTFINKAKERMAKKEEWVELLGNHRGSMVKKKKKGKRTV